MITITGYMLNILGRNVVVDQKPSHSVVKFISPEEFNQHTKTIMSKYVVKEGLPSPNGIIIVHYIKSAHHATNS